MFSTDVSGNSADGAYCLYPSSLKATHREDVRSQYEKLLCISALQRLD